MKALVLLVAVALLGGCADDFTPYSKLDRLRVLAVRSQPAMPLPGQAAELSALVFAPPGEPAWFQWAWCPAPTLASQRYACPLDDASAAELFGPFIDPAVPLFPALDLGTNETATLVNPFAPSALAGLCATGLSPPGYAFDCDEGFPLTVVLDVATPTASLRAGFVVRVPVGAAPEVNQNPTPAGLSLAGVPLASPRMALSLAPERAVDLRVEIPPDALETRAIPAYEGAPGVRLERLTASWFSDVGSIDSDRTSFIDGTTSIEETSTNSWTAPATADWPVDGIARFAVVLRDDRGGVGWILRDVLLERAP